MKVVDMAVTARWRFAGWHRWPDATPQRAYLASAHRHLFHAEAVVPVTDDNREIEFHDLLDVAQAVTPANKDWGDWSCERIATSIAEAVLARWPAAPVVTVKVFEDGECGATVVCAP